jgi:hypothetical protein
MQLPERIALGSTFIMERPLNNIVQSLDKALAALEVDVEREGPFIMECRALRKHQVVVLDIRIFNQEGKFLVSMRRCGGDRQEAIYLANDIAAAAGLRGPVVARPEYRYEPDLEEVKRYLVLLKGEFKDKMEGLCCAANVRLALKTAQGTALVDQVAQFCSSEEPSLRLAAMSAAVSLVRAGCDPRVFALAARSVSEEDDPLLRIQANHLFSPKNK